MIKKSCLVYLLLGVLPLGLVYGKEKKIIPAPNCDNSGVEGAEWKINSGTYDDINGDVVHDGETCAWFDQALEWGECPNNMTRVIGTAAGGFWAFCNCTPDTVSIPSNSIPALWQNGKCGCPYVKHSRLFKGKCFESR